MSSTTILTQTEPRPRNRRDDDETGSPLRLFSELFTLGLTTIDSLSPAHRAEAAGLGLCVKSFSAAEKRSLITLVSLFLSSWDEGAARITLREFQGQLDDTYFSWRDTSLTAASFGLTIQSPLLCIEFEFELPRLPRSSGGARRNTGPRQPQVHCVVRTPTARKG